jgi:CheY-like chemotaxis protein
LNPEICRLGTVIESFEPMLRRAVPSSISLNICAEGSEDSVRVDVVRFEAALLNLVVNARDAIAGNGRIDVRTGNVEFCDDEIPSLPAGRYVRVRVTDTGCGMCPEIVARATEPFFTTKEPGKGTGLGLSQVYGFISQSGGMVDISSEPGQGTTVTLYLPAEEDAAANGSVRATDLMTETILVVDDESEVLDATAELFRSIGYAVVTASTAAAALSRLERDREVDFLFTDVVLSGEIDGVELARRARRLRPGIRVVLASGHITPSRNGELELFDDFVFIAKPYRLAELAKAMRRA